MWVDKVQPSRSLNVERCTTYMREKAGPDLARAGSEGKLLGLALGVEVCVAVPLGLEVVEGDGDREGSDAEGDPEAGAGTS